MRKVLINAAAYFGMLLVFWLALSGFLAFVGMRPYDPLGPDAGFARFAAPLLAGGLWAVWVARQSFEKAAQDERNRLYFNSLMHGDDHIRLIVLACGGTVRVPCDLRENTDTVLVKHYDVARQEYIYQTKGY